MISSLLQVAGLIIISIGIGIIYIPAGLVAAGGCCVLVGLALEKGK